MPREKQAKIYCVDNLRHAEYYQMQECYDNLYAESIANKEFTNLNLRINTVLMGQLMMQNPRNQSIAYTDNRISLFSAQWGKCSVTGQEFYCVEDIHCHHKVPKHLGGTDAYANLVLVLEPVHRLIHATTEATIRKYLDLLNLSEKQLAKVNQLREQAGCKAL